MTNRERFLTVMSFGKPDRVPYFEEGIRKDVLEVWRQQGLPLEKNISDIFEMDRFAELAPEMDPIPEIDKWPTTLSDLDVLKSRLNPGDPKRFPENWKKEYRYSGQNDRVIFYRAHRGLFLSLGVYKWKRFVDVISLLLDDPQVVHRVLTLQAEFAATLLENILREIDIDAVIFGEPIGGNEGPLVSPAMYEEFVLQSFQPVFDVIKKNKI